MKFSQERIQCICNWLEKNNPDKDYNFYKMWMAVEILRVLVGNEWTNQAIFPNEHHTKSNITKSAIDFLRTNKQGFQFQERVYRLAKFLYDVQDIEGFSKVVNAITSGDIYQGYAELEAGSFFARRNIPFKFVIPSGIKRLDFDIEINNQPVINCEVKHKIESTELSKETLESTLSSANKQVPENQPALFFVKIPEEWVKHKDIENVLKRTWGTFFPRNESVIGVLLHWEEKDLDTEGLFYWKCLFVRNKEFKINIKDVMEKLEITNTEDNLLTLMEKNMRKVLLV